MPIILLFSLFALLVFLFVQFVLNQYKKVPVNKVLIIYGRTPDGEPKYLTEGTAWVWPFIQKAAYLDLTPIRLVIRLKDVRNRKKESIYVAANVTVAISSNEDLVMEAANRFLTLTNDKIGYLAQDIVKRQLMIDFTSLDLDELYEDWKSTIGFLSYNIEKELNKVGLELINFNISEIQRNPKSNTKFY